MAFVAVVLWYAGSALAHFALTDFVMRTLPPFIASSRDVVLLKGFVLALGIAGLVWRRTRQVTGWLLAVLTIAVVRGDLWQLAQETTAAPRELLILRVPLHIGVLLLTLWSTYSTAVSDARWSRWR